MKKVIVVFLLMIFTVIVPTSIIAKAEIVYVDEIVGTTEYTSEADVPKTLSYQSGNYKGTLNLKYIKVSSGEASKVVQYSSSENNYLVKDFCIWDSNSLTMNFSYQLGNLPYYKDMVVDGYSFRASLQCYEKGASYTRYATPDMPRGADEYQDDPWIGPEYLNDGEQYFTATHYMRGWYRGQYTTNDTRKYVGVYAGNISNSRPINDTYGIENVEFSDNRGYWVKQGDSFTIWSRAYADSRNDAYRPNRMYYSLKTADDKNEYGVIQVNSAQQKYYYKGQGTPIVTNVPIISGSFASEPNATSYARLETSINLDNLHINYSFNSSKDAGGYLEGTAYKKMFTVNSDGLAPTIADAYAENITTSGFDVVIKGINDSGGSGTKYVRTLTWVDAWATDGKWKDTNTADGDLRVRINTSDFSSKKGQYKVDIKVVDNVGNEAVVKRLFVTVQDPVPINSSIKVYEYDYKENDNNYWVKPGSVFGIYSDGYLPSNTGLYPMGNYLLFSKDGAAITAQSSREFATITGKGYQGAEFTKYFNFLSGYVSATDNGKAYKFQQNGNNYLGYRHHLSAKNDGDKFKVLYTNTYTSDKDYYNPYVDTNTWLKVDGRAPTLNSATIENVGPQGFDIVIKGISDNSGSGTKFVRTLTWVDGWTIDGKWKDTATGDGDLRVHIDTADFASKKGLYKINIKTFDNCGNNEMVKALQVDVTDALAIAGLITPNPAPAGKLLNLDITTSGMANKIKVQFPADITKYSTADKPLIFEKSIPEELYHTETFEAWLPIETAPTLDENNNRLRPAYQVYIEAQNKYGQTVSGYISLDVSGTIYKDIRYGIKATGYDREDE